MSELPKRADINMSGFKLELVADDLSGLTCDQTAIMKYFNLKTQGKRFASRADINPSEISSYIPYVFLFDVEVDDEGNLIEMKIRLLGTKLAEFYGEQTGKTFIDDKSETSLQKTLPDTQSRLERSVRMVLKHRKPIRSHAQQVSDEKDYVQVKVIMVPLSDNGTDINKIFGYTELIHTS